MGKIVAAGASSHAYAVMDPTEWDKRRAHTRGNYAKKYGDVPPEQPQVSQESDEDITRRYQNIRETLLLMKDRLQALKPDAVLVIGDDQDENYTEENLPQLAIYTGDSFIASNPRGWDGATYKCDSELAETILMIGVDAGFDLAVSARFPENKLYAHAHREILEYVDPEATFAVVPIFINAIHVPAPSPSRCYAFGQALRQIVESTGDNKKVAVLASGGLSHFTAGYPYKHYKGPYTIGSISVDFDRQAVQTIQDGKGSKLAELTSEDLLQNGDVEMRSWIAMLGAIGDIKPQKLVYEPFFRALLGMGAGYWELQ